MHYITTFKQGNSLAVVVPSFIAKEMQLTRGITFMVTTNDNHSITFTKLTPETLKTVTATKPKRKIRYYGNRKTSTPVR